MDVTDGRKCSKKIKIFFKFQNKAISTNFHMADPNMNFIFMWDITIPCKWRKTVI